MKPKYIIVLIIFLIAVAFIAYLYKRWQSSHRKVSFSEELKAKQKKLEMLLSQLSAAEIKKAVLDRIVARKASLTTCLLMLFCMSTSIIYDYWSASTFPGLYLAIIWYLLAFVSALCYHKIPSWSAIMEIITSKIKSKEYRNHNFDPNSIQVLTTKVVVLKEEIAELKKLKEKTISQNVCDYC